MRQTERRAEPRIATNFPGTLTIGDTSVPCVIQNMCNRGFLIKNSRELPVGESLHLSCELYPAQRVECTVQVRHVNAGSLGARVIEMSEEARRLCRRYLEEHRGAAPKSGQPR